MLLQKLKWPIYIKCIVFRREARRLYERRFRNRIIQCRKTLSAPCAVNLGDFVIATRMTTICQKQSIGREGS